VSRASSAQKKENFLVRYFKETRAEIAKVTWPTREEGIRLTIVVLSVTIVSALFLFAVDTVFSFLIAQFVRLL